MLFLCVFITTKKQKKKHEDKYVNVSGIEPADSITDKMCGQQKVAFGDLDDHDEKAYAHIIFLIYSIIIRIIIETMITSNQNDIMMII